MIKLIGKYFLFLKEIFKKPKKYSIYIKNTLKEVDNLGLNSLGIVAFVSLFVGAVMAIQTYNNLTSTPLPIPHFYVSHATKIILISEFAPTMISIILAGKVGSFISSSIGTMRATEQIDALEVMGINSASFLVLPKVLACLIFNPILIMLSVCISIFGGWLSGEFTGNWSSSEYIAGLQIKTDQRLYSYCIVKSIVFSFIIATVPSFFGYFVKGGSLQVGKASTKSVVWTCVLIIILDFVITQMMLG
jgi:phospholipid/cholesterol/gamma-HCH transport system permease protein